ncbi:MAG: hypothetical protein A2Y33_05205 [Spirochaetes bacterium GWF1_51_8]|nr:MAG: hypothetical protein A2Y33_05205 [Spirochaetes bacterium GWF1_51_8]
MCEKLREYISDNEILFRYIKPQAIPVDQYELNLSFFSDTDLSCDWKKYRPDPKTSFHIEEGNSWIVEINICDEIRNPKDENHNPLPLLHQEIYHDPLTAEQDPIHGENYAHSLIQGKKKMLVQEAIRSHSKIIK